MYLENVKYGPDAERAIRGMAQNGADIIFATSFGYMELMLKVAKEFPNVKFEHATGYKQSQKHGKLWFKIIPKQDTYKVLLQA